MERKHLKSFEISEFKKFTNLKIDNIGQFNLIIGDNNVGKTSLLEALLVDEDISKFIDSLANINFFIRKFDNLNSPFINSYFSSLRTSYPKKMEFKWETIDSGIVNSKSITAIKEHEFNEDYQNTFFVGNKLEINNNIRGSNSYNLNVPYIPMGFFYSHELTNLYSKYIQKFVDKKERMLSSLSFLIPQIQNIEVSITETYSPILSLTEKGKNTLSLLASYGEGALKFFRILLSLFTNNHYSRLMVDELDAGIHHSHLTNFNKSLLQVAETEQKQFFATTHSKECIESFTRALEETGLQSKGRIIRLAETKHGIKAYTMEFAEFENALLAESEIR